jgi:hypothetical protein
MTQIVLAIDGPSPNVGSGLTPPYGIPTNTNDAVNTEGTGTSLGANGITNTTMADQTVQVVPSTIPVPQVDAETSGIRSGLASPGGIPTNTVLGVATAGTGKDQVQQNATTIPSEPNQG